MTSGRFSIFRNTFKIQIQEDVKETAGRRIGTRPPRWKGMEGIHTKKICAKFSAHPPNHVGEVTEIADIPVSSAPKSVELKRDAPGPTRTPDARMEGSRHQEPR